MPTKPSPQRLAANRANAARSTGPRTPAGKARSSRNARKHTFASQDFAIILVEEQDAVARLRADLIAVYQPVNSQELFALERIAIAQHNLIRLARLESGLFTSARNRALLNPADEEPYIPLHSSLDKNPQEIRSQNRNYCLAHGYYSTAHDNPAAWSLFLRYQAQAERLYRRAVEELERLQALRDVLPNEPNFPTEPEENTATSEPKNEPNSTPALNESAPPSVSIPDVGQNSISPPGPDRSGPPSPRPAPDV